jgi:chromosome segregation ATPase
MAALFEEERRKLTEEIHKKDQELNDSRVEIRRLTAAAESFHREASERIKQGEASLGAYRSELELLRHQLQQASNEGARSQKEAAELQRKDAQIDRLTRQVASLRSHAAEHLDREKILKAQLTQSQKVQGDLREALGRSESTITSLRTTREAGSKEIAELRLTIENLSRRIETSECAEMEAEVGRGMQLEAEVARLRSELDSMQEQHAIDQIRIEAQAHKIKAQEWFGLESYTLIREAAADGRLVELLDPQTVVDLLDKVAQLKGDVERLARMRSGKRRYRPRASRDMTTDTKQRKDIA